MYFKIAQNANDDIDKAPALMSLVLCNVVKKIGKMRKLFGSIFKSQKACDKTHFCLAYIYYNNNQLKAKTMFKTFEITLHTHILCLLKK